jgi:hypothetical protein
MPHDITKALDKPVELLDETLDWVVGGSNPSGATGRGTNTATNAGSGLTTNFALGRDQNTHGPSGSST